MVFRFGVTKQLYLKLLMKMLKKKESSPFRLLCFFALTVGQSAWVVYMLLTAELSRKTMIFMLIWSLLLTAINISFRAFRPKRAETSLENLISTEQISSDYWKEHRLTISDGTASLRFGKTLLECPCDEIDISEDKDIVYLSSHGRIFDIIPADYAQKEALVNALMAEKDHETAAFLDDIDSCDEVFRFAITGKAFVSSQVRAFQQYFLMNTLRSPQYIIKMIMCLLLIWFSFMSKFGIRTVLCLLIILFWNFPAILCISPITRRYLSAKIPDLSWIGYDDTYDAVVCRRGKTVFHSLGETRFVKGGFTIKLLNASHTITVA